MFGRIGEWARLRGKSAMYGLGYFFNVLKETLGFFRRRQVGYKVLIFQILFTGFEALKINAVISLAIGAAINIIGSSLLPQFGQSKLLYTILVIVITKELGPLLTAFVVIARSGTAIATELGTMSVSHEIEAYVSVGVNPISLIAVPRFIGVTASMLVLTIYFNFFGLLGSYMVAQLIKPTGFFEYMTGILQALTVTDLATGLLKAFIFGVIISTVATYHGFSVNRASTEVPVAGIKAVGQSFMLCIVANVIITATQYV
jgi:phospholipid/cholesterol/gamma-HCH transport system permease protein